MPPRTHFIVFDRTGHVALRKSFGTALFARPFVQRKKSCFDFRRFSVAVDPETVATTDDLGAAVLTAADVDTALTAAYTPPANGPAEIFALLPKDTANWTPMRVGTYTPDIDHSAEAMSFVAQVHVLSAVFDSAIAQNCTIFVGPEAVLYGGVGAGNRKIPFSSDERDEIIGILANKTAGRDLALFIPGTLWWQDAGGMVHNTLLVFSEGEALDVGYDKKEWTGEEVGEAERAGGKPSPGAHPFAVFTWKGYEIAVQICQDSASPIGRVVDIHIVVGWGTGLCSLKHRPGGVGVYADAKGSGRVEDEFRVTPLGTTVAGTIAVTDASFARTPA